MQSGVNDFNVNARGFNSSLNRRMLVLQDGRDLAIAFLGSQEWNGMTQPLEDLGKVEVVRGPGLGALRRQRLQRRDQHHHADGARGARHQAHPRRRRAGDLPRRPPPRRRLRRRPVRLSASTPATTGATPTPAARTLNDGTSLQREYADATDEPVGLTREARPAVRPDARPRHRRALGDRDPLKNAYGSARLDYYLDNGSVLSVDGGASQVQNEIFVTGIGRVQVVKAIKPYARVAMAADRYNIFAYWNSRTSIDPQFSLQSGLRIEERSDIFHLEGQTNWNFMQERGRVVCGASFRNTRVNTTGTLMNPANDDRSDDYYSVYGQVEYKLLPQLRVVAPRRVDDGDLFDTQFSPKAALVFSPSENHSFRFSVNRAFQTPNYSSSFCRCR